MSKKNNLVFFDICWIGITNWFGNLKFCNKREENEDRNETGLIHQNNFNLNNSRNNHQNNNGYH